MIRVTIAIMTTITMTMGSKRKLKSYLQIYVGENQFVITGINHCGSVRAGKHIYSSQRLEGTKDCWLGTKCNFLPFC